MSSQHSYDSDYDRHSPVSSRRRATGGWDEDENDSDSGVEYGDMNADAVPESAHCDGHRWDVEAQVGRRYCCIRVNTALELTFFL